MTEQTNTPFIGNRTALADLLEWLEADAPTVTLNMQVGILFGNEEGAGACGTVCCIAGAAAQMADGTFGQPLTAKLFQELGYTDVSDDQDQLWEDVPERAVEYLGIDLDRLDEKVLKEERCVIDLFSDVLAPFRCKPAEAAQALRNFDMYGSARWHEIEAARE